MCVCVYKHIHIHTYVYVYKYIYIYIYVDRFIDIVYIKHKNVYMLLTCLPIIAAVCCSVWQCVAVCYSVLQCVAVCYSVLQCVAPLPRKNLVQPGACRIGILVCI